LVAVRKKNVKVMWDSEKVYETIESLLKGESGKVEALVTKVEKEVMKLGEDEVTSEDITNIISKVLMEDNKDIAIYFTKESARKELIYRDNIKSYPNLSESFLSGYANRSMHLEPLGHVVYLRSYSRFLENEKRREEYYETIARAINYNISLAKTEPKEAEELFDLVYNNKIFISGRTLYSGGTPITKEYPTVNFNCSSTVCEDLQSFVDLFYLLMLGSGVGFRIKQSDVAKLPKVRTDYEVVMEDYTVKNKEERIDFTQLKYHNNKTVVITIGDSKEGWIDSLSYYLDIITSFKYKNIKTIRFNFDNVRPHGEKLKRFGGTASGPGSIKEMFRKITTLITSNYPKADFYKLKTIDCLDIANIIGENVVSGGVRRTAEIMMIDPDDKECIEAKNDLYRQIDGQWEINPKISYRQVSNNSVFYESKPSREQMHWQIEQMRNSGEPAFINAEEARRRKPNFHGVNPCFTGDMRLLTQDGYRCFEDLAKREERISVVNKKGDISSGKVWSNGIKDIIELSFYTQEPIRCTPDHVFMTNSGEECEAKDLKGKRIMPFVENLSNFNTDYVALGFIQGDGCLGRLNSEAHKGLEVNIGENDSDIRYLFTKGSMQSDGRKYYTSEYTTLLTKLKFDASSLPERKLPLTFDTWSTIEKLSFLRGLYSANGSVIGGLGRGRVTLKTTSAVLIEELVVVLEEFGFTPNVTVNKAHMVTFDSGDYLCKESYDLNLNKYTDKLKFITDIGFEQTYKQKKLIKFLVEFAPYVKSVKEIGSAEVFDFSEPLMHWGVVEGVIAHNCGEILLDKKGLCNLTSLNVAKFVEDGKLNKDALLIAQRHSARVGYRLTRVDLELHDWDKKHKEDVIIGCSLSGWQDAMNELHYTIEEQKDLLIELRATAHEAVDMYAESIGGPKPNLVTSIKPEGTQSLVAGNSSGLHFAHSPYYIRRVRISNEDPLFKLVDYAGFPHSPEVGQTEEDVVTRVLEFPVKAPKGKTKYDVSAIEQLEIYKLFMEAYVDHNASITVHVRNHEWSEVEQWMWENWDTVVGVTFISLSEHYYDLMPYEEITEEKYLELKAAEPILPVSLLPKFEKNRKGEILLDASDCESGVCAVR